MSGSLRSSTTQSKDRSRSTASASAPEPTVSMSMSSPKELGHAHPLGGVVLHDEQALRRGSV